MSIAKPDERRFRRREASKFLADEFRIPCAPTTLGKLAVIGGGPAIDYYGRTPLYSESSLREWARSKIKTKVRSTSERHIERPEA